jgi:L-seryl-tRNA(Ser) seleniumtransferase
MVGGRSPFDNAIRLAGGKLVLANSADQLPNTISANTVMVYTTSAPEQLAKEIAIAKSHNVPIFMDAADGVPPIDKLRLFAKMGCDLYTVSGGKGLCGPQCSGVLLGRKDLIDAALANTSPWEGAVCRPMKVGKEEVIGCLTALETWLKIDETKLYEEWNGRIDRIRKLVETVPGVRTDTFVPDDGNRYPTLRVYWDQQAWRFNISDCVRELRAGDPVIEVLGADNPSLVTAVREGNPNPNRKELKGPDHIELVSMTIKPGEEIIVGQRLRAILSSARQKAGA